MDCGCVWVRDEGEARVAGVLEHYQRQRSHGVKDDVLVQCEQHRAEAAVRVAAIDERMTADRERALRRAMDLEMDLAVRGKPIRRR